MTFLDPIQHKGVDALATSSTTASLSPQTSSFEPSLVNEFGPATIFRFISQPNVGPIYPPSVRPPGHRRASWQPLFLSATTSRISFLASRVVQHSEQPVVLVEGLQRRHRRGVHASYDWTDAPGEDQRRRAGGSVADREQYNFTLTQFDKYVGPDGHVKENAMLVNGEMARWAKMTSMS